MAPLLYADAPAVRARQVLGDACCALWIAAWCWAAVAAHRFLGSLLAPVRGAGDGAADLARQLRGAGGEAARIPVVGEDLAGRLERAAGAADALAAAGLGQAERGAQAVLVVAVALAVLPTLCALAVRVPARVRWARRAGGARYLAAGGAASLLALRALAGAPPRELARLAPDPAGAWRRGEEAAVRELAALELRRLGLDPARLAPGHPDVEHPDVEHPGAALSAPRRGRGGRSAP
ncbi:hypothetical protein NUM3379_01930 [Kineococcus sp. NUM-3379]